MSIKLMSDVFTLRHITCCEKLLMLALADAANDEGVCWPSIGRLAGIVMVDERSISRMLNRLELKGMVTRSIRPGHSTVYTVRPLTARSSHPRPEGHPTPDSKVTPPLTAGSSRTTKESEEIHEGTVNKPDGIDNQLWADFLLHRSKHKAPFTETAMKGFVREANKGGFTLDEAMRISIERGWRGFNAKWLEEKKSKDEEKSEHYLRLTGRANKVEVIDV